MQEIIEQATSSADLDVFRAMCREYAAELGIDLEMQNLTQELAELPGNYAPPTGALLIALQNEATRALRAEPPDPRHFFAANSLSFR